MSRKGRTDVAPRRRVTFVTMLVAALVVPAAIAYACNPQAHVSLDKTSYQPGSSITVYGSYFPGNVNVSVSGNWGASSSVTTSAGGGFATTLSGPSSPGNYTISATRPTGGFAVASFTVAAPAPAPAAAQPSTPAASAPAATAKSTPGFKSPSVARSEAPASAERTNPPSTSGRTTTSGGGNTAGSTNVAPSNVTSTSGQQVFSGSTAQAAPAQSFAPAPATAARPSRSASREATARSRRAGRTERPVQRLPARSHPVADGFGQRRSGRRCRIRSRARYRHAGFRPVRARRGLDGSRGSQAPARLGGSTSDAVFAGPTSVGPASLGARLCWRAIAQQPSRVRFGRVTTFFILHDCPAK